LREFNTQFNSIDYTLNQKRFERKYLAQATEEKRVAEEGMMNQKNATPFELKTKKPRESLIEFRLPFSTDSKLRDLYTTEGQRGLRIGRILEDLDAFSGEISYKHADGTHPDRPLTIVTASIDRLELQRSLVPYFDLKFRGWVTWVGNSSMEIRIEVHQIDTAGDEKLAMVAYFMMVARDKYTGLAATVHQLEPETEMDKHLYKLGEERKRRRKNAAAQSLTITPPSPEESKLIHELFLAQQKRKSLRLISNDDIPMKDTVIESTYLMQPQQRNIHQKIFGGYILRNAFELAYIAAYSFSKHRPTFIALDDNAFLKPVEIGSVIKYTATIVYAEGVSCTIQVHADVIHPETGKKETTNVFYFSFNIPVQQTIVPETYNEAMMYIEGKRIHEKSKSMSYILKL
jgi:acyl-coenzyme A thioesterase 9